MYRESFYPDLKSLAECSHFVVLVEVLVLIVFAASLLRRCLIGAEQFSTASVFPGH